MVVILTTKILFRFCQTSLHPVCSRVSGRAHRMPNSTRFGLPPAPMWDNPCVMSLRALLRFLNVCNSSSRAREGNDASCIPKVCNCLCPTSLLEEHHPYLCPCSCLFSLFESLFLDLCQKAESNANDSSNPRAMVPCKELHVEACRIHSRLSWTTQYDRQLGKHRERR